MDDDSILNSIKKLLGLDKSYEFFDMDVIMNINLVFSTLKQIGVKSEVPLSIMSMNEKWSDLFGDDKELINLIKMYTYMKVRVIFDPPSNSFVLTSLNEQIKEVEWRIHIQAEGGLDVPDESNDSEENEGESNETDEPEEPVIDPLQIRREKLFEALRSPRNEMGSS